MLSLLKCKIEDAQCILDALGKFVEFVENPIEEPSSLSSYFPTDEMNLHHVLMCSKDLYRSCESIGLTSKEAVEVISKVLVTILNVDAQKLDDLEISFLNDKIFADILDLISSHATKFQMTTSINGKVRVSPSICPRGSSRGDASELAWHSDGSLWVNGLKEADNFGLDHKFGKSSQVTIRVNFFEFSVSYYVNGSFIGVAFGTPGTGAQVILDDEIVCKCDKFTDLDAKGKTTLYPAASVSSPSQSLKLKGSGMVGSLLIPFQYALAKTVSSTVGRICGALMAGPLMDKNESSQLHWLQSSLFLGGIQEDNITVSKDLSSSWNTVSLNDDGYNTGIYKFESTSLTSLSSSVGRLMKISSICAIAIP